MAMSDDPTDHRPVGGFMCMTDYDYHLGSDARSEMTESIEDYYARLLPILRNLDIAAAREIWRDSPWAGREIDDETCLAAMHKARVMWGKMSDAERDESERWLRERGRGVPPRA